MKSNRPYWPIVLAVLMLVTGFDRDLCADPNSRRPILLATTTSTRDSGLLDRLIPVFEAQTGFRIKTIAIGTGKALALGKRGDADVLLTHAPASEQPLVAAGWLIQRVPFMHNDFVIVGPPTDPAQVRNAQSATDALQRIISAQATFISRGDNSGTHKQEQTLWRAIRAIPRGTWYLESGQGMGATLRIASEKLAYTLCDRATFLHLRHTLMMTILFAGDSALHNTYSVMLVNPARHPRVNKTGAKAFHAWLLSKTARDMIRQYGIELFGQPLFILDPLPR